MEKYLAIFFFGVSAFAIAGIFWPRIRAIWEDSPVRVGIVSSIGAALIFGSAGFGALGYTSILIPILLGFVCAFVGMVWDFRRDFRKRRS